MFADWLRWYEAGLRWSLAHGAAVLVFLVLVLAGTVGLFKVIPQGFLPSEDTGRLIGRTEAAQGVSFADMVAHQRALAEIIRADENVESFMSSCGSRGGNASNTGFILVRLKPRGERKLSADEVIQVLRRKCAQVPGIMIFLQNPPPIRIGGRLSKSQYQYTLQTADTDTLYRYGQRLLERLVDLPELQDVTSDMQLNNPQVTVDIDRDRAAALGVSPQAVEDALYTAYGSRRVSTIYGQNNTYDVLMELEPEFQADPASLDLLYVSSAGGDLVPLSSVARILPTAGPLTVNHSGQLPAVTLSFNTAPGVALSSAVARVQAIAQRALPATVTTSFQGTAQAFQASSAGLGLLLLLAVVVIYLVLGVLYESFIHPLTILSALPFAGFGALITLMVFKVELSIYAFVGIIMLVGLVKKNGIIMIDFALHAQRTEGKRRPGRHLRGLRDPLPAHHDDHPGGADGHPAHRPGPGGRRRVAAAPGSGGGRRAAVLPVPDAVRDAGVLRVHGPAPEPVAEPEGHRGAGRAAPAGAARSGGLTMFGRRRRRRARLRAAPPPPAWTVVLERDFAHFRRLSAADRAELLGLMQVFLDEKHFEGCGGLELTDEMKVVIAAQACLLLLHRETEFYPDLDSILVYPEAYVAPSVRRLPDGTVAEGEQARLGESWTRGAVVLSWHDTLKGAMDAQDGHNVVLHEFAHQLDAEDGAVDGAPVLPRPSMHTAWARVLGAEYAHLLDDIHRHRPTLIDPYGATNPAEFFAVATELFFEKPRAMKARHPALYEELRQFYAQDPAAPAVDD